MIEILAWPLLAILLLILFRKRLLAILPPLKKLKVGQFEAEFNQSVSQIEREVDKELPLLGAIENATSPGGDQLFKLAEVSPKSAVLDVWGLVEQAAKALLAANGQTMSEDVVTTPYLNIEQALANHHLVANAKIRIFSELRQLRNKVVHAKRYDLSPEQAKEYVRLAYSLSLYFRQLEKNKTH